MTSDRAIAFRTVMRHLNNVVVHMPTRPITMANVPSPLRRIPEEVISALELWGITVPAEYLLDVPAHDSDINGTYKIVRPALPGNLRPSQVEAVPIVAPSLPANPAVDNEEEEQQ